jgi:hypothetical protein
MGAAFAAGIKQAVNEVKAASKAISDAAGAGVDSGGGSPPATPTPTTGNHGNSSRRNRRPRTPRHGGRIYGDFAPGLPHTNLNAVAFRSGGNVGHKAAKSIVARMNAQAAGSGGGGGGQYSTSGLVPQVKRALAWARAHGWQGTVNSGFRTFAEQQVLYARYLAGGNLAAPPGQSNHESGRAVDVSDIPGFQRAMASAPANARLKWFGPGDSVHFSVDGHRRGGRAGFAGGGRVPGTRRAADSVDAMLSPQEFVVTADGERILEKLTGVPGVLNQLERQQKPHFAGGGRVVSVPKAVVTGKPGSGRGDGGAHHGSVVVNFHGDVNVRDKAEYDDFVRRLERDLAQAFTNNARSPEELVK